MLNDIIDGIGVLLVMIIILIIAILATPDRKPSCTDTYNVNTCTSYEQTTPLGSW